MSHAVQFPASGKSFQEAQANLNQAAASLNQSANELAQASRGTTQDLAKASGKFGQDFSHFLEAGVDMAGQSQVDRQIILLIVVITLLFMLIINVIKLS